MRHAFRILLALALCLAPLTLTACNTFGAIASPSQIGCTAAEANACRIIVATSIVRAAQAATSDQLARGLITPAEAARVANLTGAAVDVLKQARDALAVSSGGVEQQLAALDVLLTQLLASEVMKRVGS